MKTTRQNLKSILLPAEAAVLKKLSSPQKIQDFLDSFPVRFVGRGSDYIFSPREVLQKRRAHCMEGAVLAAAALMYHGHPPLLLDFQTLPHDEDHVVALFKEKTGWGAISKTNHPVLRWRDPIYKSIRELAMSYFHEYYMWHGGKRHGEKTMRAYSKPFDLRRYKPEKWFTAKDLDWLAEELDASPHHPALPKGIKLRKASAIETKAMKLSEWKK